MNNTDNFLLSYLKKKYDVQEGTPLCDAAKMLLEKLWQGSVCIPFSENDLNGSKAVGRKNENKNRPLIFDKGRLYIQRYFVYQERIIDKIENLRKNGKFHIITGGPGTGKTTSLAKKLHGNFLLAAPTGKAALRMGENAQTIHRLLGHRHLPLKADVIAIDESSMVDLPLMSKLLDVVPGDCDLYLLGDKNQLASVEVGSVFADICEKFKNEKEVYTELTKNHRVGNEDIIELSKQILKAKEDKSDIELNDKIYRKEDKYEVIMNKYKDLFCAQDKENALDFLRKFQVLCATKVGRNGTAQVNKRISELAKKAQAKFTPIIITENNYNLKLFNGEVGVKNGELAYFYVDKEIKSFPVLTLPAHDLAFAITIHKSQGSEYDSVAVVYPDKEKEEFLTGELLYTAITRAKNECLIFGNKDVIVNSCKNTISRASGI